MSVPLTLVGIGALPGDGTGDRGQVPFTKVNAGLTFLNNFYGQTAAEALASVTPVNYFYPPGWVLRYGTNTTPGTTNMTTAFNNALAQRKQGGAKAFVPWAAGPYAVNLVLSGANNWLEGESNYAGDVNTTGLLAFSTTSPVLQIGDGTTTTIDTHVAHLKMHGQGTAQSGLLVFGAVRTVIDNVGSEGFTSYSWQVTASTTNPTSYCMCINPVIQPNNSSGAVGLIVLQPSNWPTSYCTEVSFLNINLQCGTSATAAAQIGNNGTTNPTYVKFVGGTIGPKNPAVVVIENAQSILYCQNLTIDDGIGGNVLVTFNGFNAPVNQCLQGALTVNGQVSMTAGNTSNLGFSFYGGNRPLMYNPAIAGIMDFQDTSASQNLQANPATQGAQILRVGTTLQIKNTLGQAQVAATALELTNAAGSADGSLNFPISGLTVVISSGGLKISGPTSSNNVTPPAQSTGWGTPVGGVAISNYNITDAGGASSNTNKAVAAIIAYLKSKGDFGA